MRKSFQVENRPDAPGAIGGNRPPDIELRLTHEQATFMLENCRANISMAFALIMSIADENIDIEDKQIKAEKFESMRKQFLEIQKLLRDAGAREKED